jgi:hypothetical protein
LSVESGDYLLAHAPATVPGVVQDDELAVATPGETGRPRLRPAWRAPPAFEREPAEQLLGRALVGRRDDVVIATKSGERRFDPAAGLSRRYIIQQVEHSLRRLGTEYIDVYYAHFPDPDTPLEQTLAVCDDLVRQGKLRYVALSNHPAWQVTQALWMPMTATWPPRRSARRSSTTSSTAQPKTSSSRPVSTERANSTNAAAHSTLASPSPTRAMTTSRPPIDLDQLARHRAPPQRQRAAATRRGSPGAIAPIAVAH